MARGLYFTLFCVLQVMTALSNVTAAPFNLTSTLHQPHIMAKVPVNPENPDPNHDKRSINIWPFDPKYLSTEHYTIEINADGTVTASSRSKPHYGVLRIMAACLTMSTIVPSFDGSLAKDKFGKVSIKGVKSNKFLCMNQHGEVYASDECSDECEFKQEGIGEGGSAHNRYYSLKYRGFKDDPKRTKKRWYLGMKNGQVLKGYSTRKRKQEVLFIQRPVDVTMGTDDRFDTSTRPTGIGPTGGRDPKGTVTSVVTSPKSSKRPRSKPNCDEKDPLNLFRLKNCSKGKRRRGNPDSQNPFSRDRHPIRHSRRNPRKQAHESETPQQNRDFNLFSFQDHPNRLLETEKLDEKDFIPALNT